MMANGTLVGGAEEQIMRCDIHPTGWVISSGGADTTNVSSWLCDNITILSDPQHCNWGPFWDALPPNATYSGKEMMDGRACNKWEYWSGGEKYALWASADSPDIPVANGKTWTSVPGYHLWHILWRDFKPGPPPLSVFALTPGIQCPNASVARSEAVREAVRSSSAKRSRSVLSMWVHLASGPH